jgi:hypothetical protein
VRPYTPAALEAWSAAAAGYTGAEKWFVDALVSVNADVVDLEMALPASTCAAGVVVAPRMDLVALEPVVGTSNHRIVFWEAKRVTDGRCRCRGDEAPEVVSQLAAYTAWLAQGDHRAIVAAAYQEACRELVALHALAATLRADLPPLGPGIRAVAAADAPLPLVDDRPRLIVDDREGNASFEAKGHLSKLRGPCGLFVQVVKSVDEMGLARIAPPDEPVVDARSLHAEARALLAAGNLDGATDAFVRLWSLVSETEPAPQLRTVHLFLVREEARELCQRHPRARAAFLALRDALKPPARDVPPEPRSFADWVSLQEVVDDREAVLHWFEQATAKLGARVASTLEGCVGDLLAESDRWADLARLLPDPLGNFADDLETCERVREMAAKPGVEPKRRAEMLRLASEFPSSRARRLARALRAAGRETELLLLVEAALAWDDGPEMWQVFLELGPSEIAETLSTDVSGIGDLPPPHTCFLVDRIPWDEPTSTWKRLARAHQARWRMARGYPIGRHPHGDPGAKLVGSRLDLAFATETGKNFLTPAAVAAVRHRLAHPEPGEMLESSRLWADLLSSMPLCFNLFGDLAADPALARHALASWWPDAPAGEVSVRFEHSPGRGDRTLLGNRTAFDVAFEIALPTGSHAILGVETKYHEHAKLERTPNAGALARYTQITERSRAFLPGWREALVGTDLQQIWLDHLLVLAMLQHPSRQWSWGRFVVVAPAANPSITSAVARYRAVLRDDATFGSLSLEQMVAEGSPLGDETRMALATRYLPGVI